MVIALGFFHQAFGNKGGDYFQIQQAVKIRLNAPCPLPFLFPGFLSAILFFSIVDCRWFNFLNLWRTLAIRWELGIKKPSKGQLAICPNKWFYFSIRLVNKPSLNFGSNQVLFGGITFPLSEMSNNCWMVTGKRLKATFISPEFTLSAKY